MLTQTLRGLERDGLATRTITARIPTRVDYELPLPASRFANPLSALEVWPRNT